MTIFDTLESSWKALEQEPAQLAGVYERRVFAHTGHSIFVGIIRPAGLIRIHLTVSSSTPTDGLERETKGYTVQRQFNATEKTTTVCLELRSAAFRSLFKLMIVDVVGVVLATSDQFAAISALRAKLNHWQKFMQSAGQEGLTREEQVGLFGELTFLLTLLVAGVPAMQALASWTGPSGANQDFQASGQAVEVKTTTRNSSTRIQISNEFQLDETDCESLSLFHLWLREQDGAGTSLPCLVDQILKRIPESTIDLYQSLLLQARYHEAHRSQYEPQYYVERERGYYEVTGDFPRIRKAELRPAVEAVEYSVDLSGFQAHRLPESEVIKKLIGAAAC